MKFIAERSQILPALQRAERTTSDKTTMPVLKCVHLFAQESALTLKATNLETSVSSTVGAVVLSPGAVGVEAKGLLTRVKQMPDTAITFTLDDDKLVLTAPNTKLRYSMRVYPQQDLPVIDSPQPKPNLRYSASLLLARLKAVLPAVSYDFGRPHLACLLLENHDNEFTAVGTDGHRLHLAGDRGIPSQVSLLLLHLGADLLAAFLEEHSKSGDPDTIVDVAYTKTNLFFRTPSVTIGMKRPGDEVRFPPYAQIIPGPNPALTVDVDRQFLTAALRSVSIVDQKVLMSLTNGTIELSAQSVDGEFSSQSVACVMTGVKVLQIKFQASYLLEALASAGGESVRLEFGGDLTPVLVRSDEDAFLAVVMPHG